MAERDRAWRRAQEARAERKRARRKRRRIKCEPDPDLTRLSFEGGLELERFLAWWREQEERREAEG